MKMRTIFGMQASADQDNYGARATDEEQKDHTKFEIPAVPSSDEEDEDEEEESKVEVENGRGATSSAQIVNQEGYMPLRESGNYVSSL